jgi:hypothetical protein
MALAFVIRYISSISEVIRMDWYSALFRILTLVAFVGTFAYLFGLLRTEWEFTARPISIMVAGIVRDGLVKAFRLFSMVYLLSAGVSLLLEPYANYGVVASSLELGVISAGCVVLHDLTTSWGTFHEIMREIILGLVAVVVLVNTFITIPFYFPTLLMVIIAFIATVGDLTLSFFIRYGSRQVTGYLTRRGDSRKVPVEARSVTATPSTDSGPPHSPSVAIRVESSRPFLPALSGIEFDSYRFRPIPTANGEEAILEFKDEWVSDQRASHPVQEGKLVLSWLAVALRDRLSVKASEIDNVPIPPERPHAQFLSPLDSPSDLQVLFNKLCSLDDKLLRTYLRACDLYQLATQAIDDRPSLANFLLVSSVEVLGTIVTPGDSFAQSFLNFIKRYCPKDVLYANNPNLPADELLSKVQLYRSQYAHGGKDLPVASSLAHALGLVWVRHFEEEKEELAPSISWFEHVVNATLMQFLRETVTGSPAARKRERLINLALSFGTVRLKAKRSIEAGELLKPEDVELQ